MAPNTKKSEKSQESALLFMFCQIDHRWRWRRFFSSDNKFYQLSFCELHDQHNLLNFFCRISYTSKFYIACFDKIVLNLLFSSKFSNAQLQNFLIDIPTGQQSY